MLSHPSSQVQECVFLGWGQGTFIYEWQNCHNTKLAISTIYKGTIQCHPGGPSASSISRTAPSEALKPKSHPTHSHLPQTLVPPIIFAFHSLTCCVTCRWNQPIFVISIWPVSLATFSRFLCVLASIRTPLLTMAE